MQRIQKDFGGGNSSGQFYKVTSNAFHSREELELDLKTFFDLYQTVYEYVKNHKTICILLLKIKPRKDQNKFYNPNPPDKVNEKNGAQKV